MLVFGNPSVYGLGSAPGLGEVTNAQGQSFQYVHDACEGAYSNDVEGFNNCVSGSGFNPNGTLTNDFSSLDFLSPVGNWISDVGSGIKETVGSDASSFANWADHSDSGGNKPNNTSNSSSFDWGAVFTGGAKLATGLLTPAPVAAPVPWYSSPTGLLIIVGGLAAVMLLMKD